MKTAQGYEGAKPSRWSKAVQGYEGAKRPQGDRRPHKVKMMGDTFTVSAAHTRRPKTTHSHQGARYFKVIEAHTRGPKSTNVDSQGQESAMYFKGMKGHTM